MLIKLKSLSVCFALHSDTEVGRKDCAFLLVLHEMLDGST